MWAACGQHVCGMCVACVKHHMHVPHVVSRQGINIREQRMYAKICKLAKLRRQFASSYGKFAMFSACFLHVFLSRMALCVPQIFFIIHTVVILILESASA